LFKERRKKNKGEVIMENVVSADQAQHDNLKTVKGIGLYKIRYEMDVSDSSRDHNYVVGVIAYTSKEAVDTLADFGKNNIKGFKGMRVDEVAFEGLCHAMSDSVKTAILNVAVAEGDLIRKEQYDAILKSAGSKVKTDIKTDIKKPKKSIIPK